MRLTQIHRLTSHSHSNCFFGHSVILRGTMLDCFVPWCITQLFTWHHPTDAETKALWDLQCDCCFRLSSSLAFSKHSYSDCGGVFQDVSSQVLNQSGVAEVLGCPIGILTQHPGILAASLEMPPKHWGDDGNGNSWLVSISSSFHAKRGGPAGRLRLRQQKIASWNPRTEENSSAKIRNLLSVYYSALDTIANIEMLQAYAP